jgi:Na+-translocating ferredoxin:NAD+ oxidoreductase RnfG subunit
MQMEVFMIARSIGSSIALLLPVFAGMAVLFSSCLGQSFILDAGYTPGTYEGTGSGYRGPIRVSLQISQAGIEDITILEHEESAFPGLAAMEELLDLVLETESTDLDVISGATFSSRGFLEAVEDALKKQPASP